jgi:hypothetical protein
MVGDLAQSRSIANPFLGISWRPEIFLSTVGGDGSPHEKGVGGGERLAQKRDRNEVTNSRSESKKENSKKVFNIISGLRPRCSS